ncbi:MAG: tRNA (N6-isopentenyl adenosine(37)-C2)-methylthiotransferase MiaB [Candidatus Margulisiibacteriota bacterium]|nr:tRNA (N6-isopentenyl adenosine(37)-C2)-methylthiotransferase MiaB [Candidatus Margulisiibacteriota bacterium]
MKQHQVYIETYGCQMNVYDSELVKSILTESDYLFTDNIKDASVALLNTCSVRENANNKVLNRIHEIKRQNTSIQVGILGCMATNFKTQLLDNKKLKIDLIAGPDSYKQLPTLIKDAIDTNYSQKPFDVTLSEFETYEKVVPTRDNSANAWVAIMRGCNNFCTFCVVPYTRGRERSRSVESVLDEINKLVDQGFKQVTLLGQNVNSYRFGNDSFTDLLDEVSSKTNIERIRFTSPHPKDFPDDLLDLISERENICKQIHVPLQAGNDRVLKKMNRTYTQNEFLDLTDKMKQKVPNVALSTDIIIGFPTETYDEFLDTKRVCEHVKFDHAYIFKYSERPNTRAALKFPDDIPPEEKTKRITELVQIQKAHSLEKNQRWVGQTQRILVERIENEQAIGRNDANVLTYTNNLDNKLGDYITVNIDSASPHGLKASRV